VCITILIPFQSGYELPLASQCNEIFLGRFGSYGKRERNKKAILTSL
jgi:hypothetical protein